MVTSYKTIPIVFIAVLALVGCDNWFNPAIIPLPSEIVLQEGARLVANTSNGNITVIAGNKFERRYEWNGCGIDAHMFPRKNRWFGSLGMYDAAARMFYNPWAGCDGISRPVVEESQIHFADEHSAEVWITRRKRIDSWFTVWTNDGIFIQWGLSPQRNQLNVDLMQICIKGKKPTKLTGAVDTSISVFHPNGHESSRRECVDVSADVIIETQKTLSEDWRKTDELIAKSKQ